MATKEQKTERRWVVIKSSLFGILLYVILLLSLHIYGTDVTPLDHLTTMIFSMVGALGVGNWMTKPIEDD